MDGKPQTGYLVFADISGYTSFLAKTELEHSQAILSELMELLLSRLIPVLHLADLEGDAVFAYVPDTEMARGETLLELIESVYVAFRDRVESIRRHTTCECDACRMIPSLDLKFIVTHGTYLRQNVAGIDRVVGSDVNLIHRLSKNHVAEATGWRAYVLFTQEALECMGVHPAQMYEQAESYEHLGMCKTCSMDLHPRYSDLAAGRRVYVTPEEAQSVCIAEYAAPPALVWDALNDPVKRALYTAQPNARFVAVSRPAGRTAAGARNHCLHGKDGRTMEEILDWKPFDYFTATMEGGGIAMQLTYQLEPLDGGRRTRLHLHAAGRAFLPGPLGRAAFKAFARGVFQKMLAGLGEVLAHDRLEIGDSTSISNL